MNAETIIILAVVTGLFVCGSLYRQLYERQLQGEQYVRGLPLVMVRKLLLVTSILLAVSAVLAAYAVIPEKRNTTLLVWALCALLLASMEGIRIFWSIRKIGRGIGENDYEEQIPDKAKRFVQTTVWLEEKTMKRKDLAALFGVMILYSIVTFLGLGSTKMPQTYMEMIPDEAGTHEIILDMGTDMEIDSLYMHLGHMIDRIIAVSYYDEARQEWIPINKEVELDSNYNWNEIAIGKNIRYLGIVSRNGKAVFHEMVLLNEQGELIVPVNAGDYPLLFDEQELFPENLTYYYRTMFDEVYYAGSAYEFLNGMEMFEITHPPMGKILIAIGELLFGVNPFGWRFMCALFGLLMLPFFYWFLYRMFRNTKLALAGTILLSLDFMHFALSRIATLDSIIAFFILAMFAVMWRITDRAGEEMENGRKTPSAGMVCLMLWCAFLTGMGVATKWTGFYAMAGIAVLFLAFIIQKIVSLRRQGQKCTYPVRMLMEGILIFGLIPVSIYIVAFVPQSLAVGEPNVFKVMWESSLFMLNFHSDIVFDHPYSSPWYTWCLNLVPLMDAGTYQKDGSVCMITTMGNPVIWWCGLASFFHMLYRTVFKKDKKASYLCVAYLVMYVPWFFVQRTVFIYQYYGSSLFMIGMLAYSLCLLEKKFKKIVPVFLEVALFVFILFFPVISGYPVSAYHMGIYLEWMRTWEFVGL